MPEPLPEANLVYTLAASPSFARDGICFAGQTAGLLRSSDGGVTWANAYASLGVQGRVPTTAVAFSPRFDADGHVFAGAQGSVLRSDDGGVTWAVANLPEPMPLVSALALAPDYNRGGTLWAATMQDGVLRSPDGAASWEAWNFGLIDPRVICLAVAPGYRDESKLYAGTETGIYISQNSGRSWQEVAFPVKHAPVLCLTAAPGALFAGTESAGVFRSWDRGDSWHRGGELPSGAAINAILVDEAYATTLRVLVLADGALFLSKDAGNTWQECETEGGTEELVTAVAAPSGLAPGAVLLLGTVDGTVIRTEVAGIRGLGHST